MRTIHLLLAGLLALGSASGCGGDDDGDADGDGDIDGDIDGDGDVDADGDVDGDADGDVDGDVDGDADGDGDGDGDASAWIGIPDPPFGLHDSHDRYAGDPGFTAGPDGPYTHYVDNTSPACSDSGPGTEAAPRCTIPTNLGAGAVVEVHGGPYELTTQETVFQIDGTESHPSWLRGIGEPEIDAGGGENRHWAFGGSYFVVEGFRFVGGATVRFGSGLGADHYTLRGSEVDFGERNCVNAGGSYGVIYDNHLHHCHRQPGHQDTHGAMILPGSTHIWLLANHIHHNFGNGIQWGHGAEDNRPDFVFVAGNRIHDDRETGIASKWSNRSVISSNTIYSYRPSSPGIEWCAEDGSYCNTPSSGSAGQGAISGADGYPTEEWFLFNTLYDVQSCFRLEDAIRASYVGNVCYDAVATGLRLEKSGNDTQFVHNTFYNVGTGGTGAMIQQDWRDEFENMVFANNILHTTAGHMIWFEDFGRVVPSLAWDSNYHYNGGDPFTIDWRSSQVVTTLADLEAAMTDTASLVGNAVADPVLVDVRGHDFHPAPGLPVIGAANSVLIALDGEYQATFGSSVSIIPDCWSDGVLDIGALCVE